MKIILGFTGEIGSGKGLATRHLAEKYGATIHRTSKMLRDLLDRLYVSQTRENMQNISTLLREMFSEDIMAKVIYEDVQKDANEIVTVDGIRFLVDVAHLKNLPEFKLVYLEAPERERYDRVIHRNQNPGENKMTFDQFQDAEGGESESQVKELKKVADYIIQNDGTKEEFLGKIDKIIEELRKK